VGLWYERTLVGAARPHAWAALHPRLQLAAQAVSLAVHLRGARMTATLGALLLVISTIALLPLLPQPGEDLLQGSPELEEAKEQDL